MQLIIPCMQLPKSSDVFDNILYLLSARNTCTWFAADTKVRKLCNGFPWLGHYDVTAKNEYSSATKDGFVLVHDRLNVHK